MSTMKKLEIEHIRKTIFLQTDTRRKQTWMCSITARLKV